MSGHLTRSTLRGFNLSRWAIDHGNFTAFFARPIASRRRTLPMAHRTKGGPRLHVPSNGRAGAVARLDRRGDAGAGGQQDRTQTAGNTRPRPALLHPVGLRQYLCQSEGRRAATILTLTFLPALYASSFRVATSDPNPRGDQELPVQVASAAVLLQAAE